MNPKLLSTSRCRSPSRRDPARRPSPPLPGSSEESTAEPVGIGAPGRVADGPPRIEQLGARRSAVDAAGRAGAGRVACSRRSASTGSCSRKRSAWAGWARSIRALDTKLDRQVALKLLPPDQAS